MSDKKRTNRNQSPRNESEEAFHIVVEPSIQHQVVQIESQNNYGDNTNLSLEGHTSNNSDAPNVSGYQEVITSTNSIEISDHDLPFITNFGEVPNTSRGAYVIETCIEDEESGTDSPEISKIKTKKWKSKPLANDKKSVAKVKQEFDNDPNGGLKLKKRFCQSWFNIPEVAPWLEESVMPYYSYCKFCQKDLTAGKSELYRHMKSAKHRKKAQLYGYSTPSEEYESPSVICNVTPSLSVKTESTSSLPARKKYIVYLADDMHVPQCREVLEAGLTASTSISDINEMNSKVHDLEKNAAHVLGKESALFVLTGTIANCVAILGHCDQSDSSILMGDRSFIYRNCQVNLTRLNHLNMIALRNSKQGTIDLSELKTYLSERENADYSEIDQHLYKPKLICIENPHTSSGGQLLDSKYLSDLSGICSSHSIPLHLDGARILHAAFALNVSPAEIASHASSVTMCLNKGLDVQNGSIIAGDKDFIDRCRELQNVFCVQSVRMEGLAASASLALAHYVQYVSKANISAKNIEKGLSRFSSSSITTLFKPTTNVVMLKCDNIRVNPEILVDRLRQVPPNEVTELQDRISIICKVWSEDCVRLMTHSGVSADQVAAVIKKIKYLMEEYDSCLVINYNNRA